MPEIRTITEAELETAPWGIYHLRNAHIYLGANDSQEISLLVRIQPGDIPYGLEIGRRRHDGMAVIGFWTNSNINHYETLACKPTCAACGGLGHNEIRQED